MRTNQLIVSLCFLLLLFISSCKHELEDPEWTVDLVAPIAKTELSLTDLLNDSIVNVEILEDESLLLVYLLDGIDTNLNHLSDDGGLQFDQTDSIAIPPFEFPDIDELEFEASLEKIIENTILAGTLIDGTTSQVNAATIQSNSFDLDEITDFNELFIKSATIEITLINDLPTDIKDLSFILKNQDPLYPDNIIEIASSSIGISSILSQGASTTITDTLKDVLVTNSLLLQTGSFEFLGAPPTFINTSIGIKFKILIKDIIVERITAVIDELIVLDSTSEELYVDIEGINVKSVKVESGSLDFTIATGLDVPIQINFYSPNISPPLATELINLSSGSGSFSIPLGGKIIDFSGKNNDTINSFYYELHGFIPASTDAITVSIDDILAYEISASALIPSYIRGDVQGLEMEIEKDSFEFDFFSELEMGTDFSIESANINFEIESGLGVGCNLDINIYSSNTAEGLTENMNFPFCSVNAASINYNTEIVTPGLSIIPLDVANIINVKPDIIAIDGVVALNQGTDNFIVYNKGIAITPTIEIPLSFIASNLILSDTSEINLPSDIDGAILKLIIDNGYPLNTHLDINFLDVNNVILNSKDHTIGGGIANAEGRVYKSTRSVLEISIDAADIEQIKKVHYLASFETSSQTEYNKIYSDYSIGVQIIVEYQTLIGE